MKHWLYVSAIRGRMMEYYLLPCSKRIDVLTTVDSFSGSIVDANVIYSDEIVECFDFSGDIGEGGSTVFAGVAFLKKISATFPSCECFCEEPNVSNAVLSDNDRHLLLAAILRVDSNRARDGQTSLETAS